LVHPDYGKLGLGKFLVEYLYWQASEAGLRARSTISRDNPASLRSQQAVGDFEVVVELRNDYLMIEFPVAERGDTGASALSKPSDRTNWSRLPPKRVLLR